MEARTIILKAVLLFVMMVAGVTTAKSQTGYVRDTLWAQDSVIRLSMSVLHPSLITLKNRNGVLLKDSLDYIIKDDSLAILQNPSDFNQQYILRHQILSPVLTQPYTWIDTQLVKSDYLIKSIPTGLQTESAFPAWSDISYSGHFGRGLTIGNAQNATLNSNFDLQMQGKLPHGIEVTGTLSDNSIPIQPDGNSQRLQEFDKVFIRLQKEGATLIAGDHEIRNPDNYFIQYYKKTKGVFGQLHSELASGWNHRSSLNYSVSKGKFKRINIDVEEGNQGPYRLSQTGNNLFVIVLAGTERVYLDGALLQRGELNDYTIDYNLGELTFTPKIYVSATSRIVVEYEFAEQNYLRSLLAGNTTWEKNDWTFGLMIYNEQDGKNAYQNNLLTPENEAILAEAGNDVQNLQGSSVVPWKEGYEEGVVLYQLLDTMGYEKVLHLVKKPVHVPLYTASFSYVGQGNGDYLPDGGFTNGEIFYWVAPDPDGSHNGSYAPITQLQAPQSQQMFGFKLQKKWGQESRIFSEWSLSNENVNRFSATDDSRDAGWAQRSGFTWGRTIDSLRRQSFRIDGSWEWRHAHFNPISPYRPVEFQRDWNYQLDEYRPSEQLYDISVKYQDKDFSGNYSFQRFEAGNLYDGNRHEAEVNWNQGKWKIHMRESLLTTESEHQSSIFSRPRLELGGPIAAEQGLEWRAGYEGEYNAVRPIGTDSLTAASVRFDKIYGRFEWQNISRFTFSKRTDYVTDEESFSPGFRSHDLQLYAQLGGDRNSVQWTGTLRHIKVLNNKSRVDQNQQGWNLLGQLLFSNNWFGGGWTNQGEISLANGKEPQRHFQYIRVETGKGQYKHVDLNQDSIQQLNEFFPAIYPDERNYIRVSTLENTLVSTFNYNLKWAWNIRLAQWTDHSFWSKWSTENSLRVDNKQLRQEKIHLWNIPDTTLVSSRQNILTNVYFNRNGQKLQEHAGYWIRKQKNFLNSGFETYQNTEVFSKTTVLYTSAIHSLWEIKQRQVDQSAENFNEKNFTIRFWELSHKFRWLIQSTMQLEYKTAFLSGAQKAGPARSRSWTHQLSGQYRPDLKWSVQSSVDFVKVRFDHPEFNLSLEQVMLEGLQAGGNFLWETNVQRRLPNDLVISLRYNGRKTGYRGVIHQGSVQANLLF